MHSLRELQQQMAADLLASSALASGAYAKPNGLTRRRRLQVYRNNMYASLTTALQACYPVVERLVGTEFFRYAAEHYLRRTPSRSANLHDYGQSFGEFLRELPALTELPYLPDVAQLEWACQEVYHSEQSPRLDLSLLSQVPTHAYADLRLHLNAATRLVRSDYPILRIWQVNQVDYRGDDQVDLNEGGVRLLLSRRDGTVEFTLLKIGEFSFLDALCRGHDLQHAYELAVADAADFDLPTILARHVSCATLAAFSLADSQSMH
jgi:hypothetical protein